jgi:F-type H+-transporting ATPase subunit a
MEHQTWFAAILNKLLGGAVTPLLAKIGRAPADTLHPIPNYVAMEILVILLLLTGMVLLRRRLSVENPGKFQHIAEIVVTFTQDMCEEIIGHGSGRYVAMIATLGIFIVLCNLLGMIPTLQTPTAHIQVALGCAVAVFLYYNFQGVRQHGVIGYLKHLSGPMLAIAIVMFPIEVIGNVGRLLSLSVRLYANMMVGDLLEWVFSTPVPTAMSAAFHMAFLGPVIAILAPTVFMALHVFVSLLQAYIFMLLPAVYIGMAVSEEH